MVSLGLGKRSVLVDAGCTNEVTKIPRMIRRIQCVMHTFLVCYSYAPPRGETVGVNDRNQAQKAILYAFKAASPRSIMDI